MLFYGVCQFVDEFESLLSRQETLSLAKVLIIILLIDTMIIISLIRKRKQLELV